MKMLIITVQDKLVVYQLGLNTAYINLNMHCTARGFKQQGEDELNLCVICRNLCMV